MSVCACACVSPRRGIVPRAVCDLFAVLRDAAAEGTSAVVTCSYLHIYNDKLFDLLADRSVRMWTWLCQRIVTVCM